MIWLQIGYGVLVIIALIMIISIIIKAVDWCVDVLDGIEAIRDELRKKEGK